MGTALLVLGGIVLFVGNIMVLIQAFRASIVWGLGSLFIPLVSLIFVATHWAESKKGFLIALLGLVVLLAGVALSPTPDFAAE
jgi:hypothetical protein